MSKEQKNIKKDKEEINNEAEKINETEETTNNEAGVKEAAEVILKMAEKLKTLEDSNSDYIKALQRERADFENFRKRNQSAVSDGYANGRAETIAAILPVLDNFERALGTVSDEDQEQPFAKGILMVYKQLKEILQGLGLTEIEAQGEQFDPNFHHAVMQESAAEGEQEGFISEVFGKGYLLNGKVLRHSMVKVTGPAE